MQIPARRILCCGNNGQIHTDYRVLCRKRDGMATLWVREGLRAKEYPWERAWPLPGQAFIAFLGTLHWGWSLSGVFNAAPPGSATAEEKDYQDMICLGRKGGRFSQGEKGPEPLSPGTFIRFIRIGIQIKLINHCQPVRVKQYKIYRELWGLILSYSQLVRGP